MPHRCPHPTAYPPASFFLILANVREEDDVVLGEPPGVAECEEHVDHRVEQREDGADEPGTEGEYGILHGGPVPGTARESLDGGREHGGGHEQELDEGGGGGRGAGAPADQTLAGDLTARHLLAQVRQKRQGGRR